MVDSSPGDVRFAADVMLGSLAQYLLLCGYDCSYHKRISDPDLVDHALREDRVLLTRDEELVRRAPEGLRAHHVRARETGAQLRETLEEHELDIQPDRLFTRCTKCNRALESVPPKRVESEVPDRTFSWVARFYRCPGCGKIYWKGSHYEDVLEQLHNWGLLSEEAK